MTELLRIDRWQAEPGAVSGPSKVSVAPDSWSASVEHQRLSLRIPFFIPRDQAYYWTRQWQEDEAKALEELERGEGVIFYNPKEAVRWLRSPED